MKNRQWILKTLSVLLVLSVLSASFGALIVFAEDGDGAQANSVTYDDKWDGTTDTTWESKDANTFYITSGAELAGLAAQVNNKVSTYEGKTFLITKNIDLNGDEHNWTPIADYGKDKTLTFNGTLKGALGGDEKKAVTIGNMSVTGSTMRRSLISTQDGGGIENITMVNATVTQTAAHGGACFLGKTQGNAHYENLTVNGFTLNVNAAKSYYGGIVGVIGAADSDISFENCSVNNFTFKTSKAATTIGGFAGQFQAGTKASFTDCSVTGFTLDSSAANTSVGGFLGYVYEKNITDEVSFTNCDVTDVTLKTNGVNAQCIGGFVGNLKNTTIKSQFTNCDVKTLVVSLAAGASTSEYVGGFAGYVLAAATFQNCSATDVTISTTGTGTYIGGFAGYVGAAATFNNCDVNTCTVTTNGKTKQYISGFTPDISKGGTFEYCDVDGFTFTATGTASSLIGGFVARVNIADMEFVDCNVTNLNMSVVGSATSQQWLGGFMGYNGKINNTTFTDCDVSGALTISGTPGIYVGGLAGLTRGEGGSVTDCEINVNISGNLNVAGGIIGCVYCDDTSAPAMTIQNSTYTGTITSTSGSEVGGLIGRNIGTMASLVNCTMAGTVTAEGGTNVGALVGCMTGEVEEDDVMVTKKGALTMEGCTVTSNVGYNWFGVDTKDYDITLKNGDVEVAYNTLKVKYQKNTNDTNALRLIATVNGEAMTNYQRVGFKLTNSEGKVATLWTQTVYKKITADGKLVTPEDEDYGTSSTYFFAVTLTGVPIDETFTVQAFVEVETLDGCVTVAGEVFNCCLADLT
ncbi:MAG: hypothetical protein IJX94_03275 [Clostridia bacterium]|nr:hypothetical protein [Clostridia bacterium]